MGRDDSAIQNVLGGVLFCALSLGAAVGWGYLFATEQYPNLSRLGELLVIGLGLALAPVWVLAGTWVAVTVVTRQWKAHPAWLAACLLTGLVGGLANLCGWATYLGPAV